MSTNQNAPFYVVSMGKFTLLFFATLGMYGLYWFYLLFRTMEARTGRNLFPIGRALFSIFFVVELFGFVYKEEEKNAPDTLKQWRPTRLAWVFIGVGIYQLMMQFIALEFELGQFWRIFSIVSSLAAQFYVLYQVQLSVNRITHDSFGRSNARISPQNMLAIVFGTYIWINIFYTAYLISTGQITSTSDPIDPGAQPSVVQPSQPPI